MLRRETAIELPITPSKSQMHSLNEDGNQIENVEYQLKNERQQQQQQLQQHQPSFSRSAVANDHKLSPLSSFSNQNSPRNSQYLHPSQQLPQSDQQQKQTRFLKKSSESLQKNSSSDTEYSLQPYRFIKQSSNETNSSFNIDNSSITNDLSLDQETTTSLNTTVIENPGNPGKRDNISLIIDACMDNVTSSGSGVPTSAPIPVPKPASESGKSGFQLKKQFSIDQYSNNKNESKHVVDINTTNLSKLQMQILKESSSTSTDDNRDDGRVMQIIPSISTNLVQDEIAKLSSNIKSSTDEDKDKEPPFNETMC